MVILASLFLAACNLPNLPSSGITFSVGPTAWIDSPVNGAHLPLGPVALIGHAYDTVSVAGFEWSVNGTVINNQPTYSNNGKLYNGHAAWTPTEAGKYTLSMRALSASNTWSEPVSVVIEIGNFIDKVQMPNLFLTVQPTSTTVATSLPTTPAPQVIPHVTAHLNLNCHRGAGVDFINDGTLFAGASANILGINADSTWVLIENPQIKGNRCWVLRASVDTTGDLSLVKIMVSPTLVVKQPPAKQPPANTPASNPPVQCSGQIATDGTCIPAPVPTPCAGPVINGICYSP